MSLKLSVNDGMYTVVLHDNGKMEALRYDEYDWRDLTGDSFVYFLVTELDEAYENLGNCREKLQEANEKINKLEVKVDDLEREIMGDDW